MATGIEHRSLDTVMQVFDNWKRPNWAIYSGTIPRETFESDNIDESREYLCATLEAIAASGTNTTYTIRSYADNTKEINSKTPFKASTTFMLGSAATTRGENGVTIIDRTAYQPPVRAIGNTATDNQLEQLRQDNERLKDKLHQQEIAALRAEIKQAIGQTTQPPEPETWEKIIGYIHEKPELIGNILTPITDMLKNIFAPAKNYIVDKPTAAVNGTAAAAPQEQQQYSTVGNTEEVDQEGIEDGDYDLTPEGALINPFIFEDEKKISEDQQNKLFIDRLSQLTEEQNEDVQNICLEIIADRISQQTLSRMLIVVAGLSNKKMNQLLSHLE